MTKSFQNYKRAAIEFIKAEGNYLFDRDNERYLDSSIGIGVINLGSRPEVKATLQKQSKEIWHTSSPYLSSLQEEVTGKSIGDKDYLAFFANNGAETDGVTTKIARKATGKQEIITFVNSSHGRTLGSMSATGQDQIKDGFGDVVLHFSYMIYNDLDSVKSLVTDDTTAIMLELIQGESGIRPTDKGFVTALSAFCQETGTLLIVDKVQTDVGRTGKLFSFGHYGIEPGIFTLVKGLGDDVLVSAISAKEKTGFAFPYDSHGSIFGGNKPVMSAVSSILDIVLAGGFLLQAFGSGNCLQVELRRVLTNDAGVADVRGLDYIIGIETTENLTELVEKACDKGLIVLTVRTNVIRLLPPLTLTEEEIDQGVAILAEVFA